MIKNGFKGKKLKAGPIRTITLRAQSLSNLRCLAKLSQMGESVKNKSPRETLFTQVFARKE